MNATVFVTGGTGMLGQPVVRRLLRDGIRLRDCQPLLRWVSRAS